jgi:hypothetical protein
MQTIIQSLNLGGRWQRAAHIVSQKLTQARALSRAGLAVLLAGLCGGMPQQASAITASDVATSINGYNNAFMVSSGSTRNYKKSISNGAKQTGWGAALCIMGMQDAYERTGDASHKAIVSDLCNTFLNEHPTPWNWTGWNDDLAWMSLVMIRAHHITGNSRFLAAARSGFDLAWSRGWDTASNGGGIWELQPADVPAGQSPTKNALSNHPNGTAACLIYKSNRDVWYLDRAKQIYAWSRIHIYNPSTGKVYTSIKPDGSVDTSSPIYSQGSFIDFANQLHQITGDPMYYNDAMTAANYTRNSLTNNGLISNNSSYLDTWADELARGLGRFTRDNRLWSTYHGWMLQNADALWSRRRTDWNITWNGWSSQTPTDNTLGCSKFVSAVAWMQFTPPTLPSSIGGTHVIASKVNGIAIDKGSSSADGAGVILWGKNGGQNQKWNFTPNMDGTWNIVSQSSWKALEVAGGSTANGLQMTQWTWNRGSHQRWYVELQSDGSYRIRNKTSGAVLDSASSSTNGAPLKQWSWNGGNQQRWILQ